MRDEEAREERDGGGERDGAVGEEPARVEARPAGDPEVGRAQGRRRSPQPRQQRRRGHRGERDERAADEDLPPQPVRRAVCRRQRRRHRAGGGYPSFSPAWSSRAPERVGSWVDRDREKQFNATTRRRRRGREVELWALGLVVVDWWELGSYGWVAAFVSCCARRPLRPRSVSGLRMALDLAPPTDF